MEKYEKVKNIYLIYIYYILFIVNSFSLINVNIAWNIM